MDEEQDTNPEQDEPQLPTEDQDEPLPLEQDDSTPDLLSELDTASEELDKAGEAEQPQPPESLPPAELPLPVDSGPDISAPPDALDPAEAMGEEPDLSDLDEAAASLDGYGDKLNAFDDAGGADNSPPNMGQDDDGGGERDGAQQLMDSDFDNRSQVKDMLIEHARRIDEITMWLERERL